MDRRNMLKLGGAVAMTTMAAPRAGFGQNNINWAERIARLPQPEPEEIVITACGDMMVSDPVSNRGLPEVDALYQLIGDADISFGNCETTIADTGTLRGGFTQTAHPRMLDDFRLSGFNMMSLANNHTMDLGQAGLMDWIEESESRGITVAGAGANLEQALAPGVRVVNGKRIGLLAFFCTNNSSWEDFRAGDNKAGCGLISGSTVSVPGEPFGIALPHAEDMQTMTDAIRSARAQVDTLMVSFHMNWGLDTPPGENYQRAEAPLGSIVPADLNAPLNKVAIGRQLIAHTAIDAGADMVFGHGPHVLHGIELYQGKPVFYSLGHIFFQLLRNGRALPQMQMNPTMVQAVESRYFLEEYRWSAIARIFVRGSEVTRVQMIPAYMDVQLNGYPYLPSNAEADDVNSALVQLSQPFNGNLRVEDWYTELLI